jgi:hypothetical protein
MTFADDPFSRHVSPRSVDPAPRGPGTRRRAPHSPAASTVRYHDRAQSTASRSVRRRARAAWPGHRPGVRSLGLACLALARRPAPRTASTFRRRSSSFAAVRAGFFCWAWAQDPAGRPGPARRGSKLSPNFCKVRTTKARAVNPSLIAGCDLMPVGVRTISPSSAMRAERASARSTAWQACVSISTPAASLMSYSAVTLPHKARP